MPQFVMRDCRSVAPTACLICAGEGWIRNAALAECPLLGRPDTPGWRERRDWPNMDLEFGVPLLTCSGSLTLHQDTEGSYVLSSDFAVHAEPEEFRDLF